MADCCVIEKPDGSIAVIHVNWNKYTLDPAETGKTLIPDLDLFIDGEIAKQPNLLGARHGYHDDINHPNAAADRAAAIVSAKAKNRLRMPPENLPARNKRRDAWRFNPAKNALIDDQEVTTKTEVAEAIEWSEGEEIQTPGNSPKARKIQQGKGHLLTDNELDQIVSDWRGSGKAPPESGFTPPPGRKPPPKPQKRAV